jgi:hypothetical protein
MVLLLEDLNGSFEERRQGRITESISDEALME